MKKVICIVLISLLLTGCPVATPVTTSAPDIASTTAAPTTESTTASIPISTGLSAEAYALSAMQFKADILEVGTKAEDIVNTIKAVWHNSIHEVRDPKTNPYTYQDRPGGYFHEDFNDALAALFAASTYSVRAESIEEARPILARELRSFRDYPDGCEHIYEALIEFHSACDDLMELAVDPTGSLQTYSAKIDDVYSDFTRIVNNLDVEIDLILNP